MLPSAILRQMATLLLLAVLKISRAASSPGVITIPVHRSEEGFYTATIDVVGQHARLLVDSGSGDVWIPVVDTGSSIAALASKATTGRPFHIKYGSGAASGTVQSGAMIFPGGSTATCEYGLATREEGQLKMLSGSVDGILGLSLAGGIEGLVKCLRREDKIAKQTVTFELTDTGGSIKIGDAPSGLRWLPITGQGRSWSVALEGLKVKRGAQSEEVLDGAEVALLDTGSSGIRAPKEAVAKLAYKLTAEERDGHYRVPCESRQTVADIVLRFTTADSGGKFEVSINSRHLLGDADSAGWCTLKVAPSTSGMWILGGLFFRRMKAVVFDYKEKTISLQPKTDDAPPALPIPAAVPTAQQAPHADAEPSTSSSSKKGTSTSSSSSASPPASAPAPSPPPQEGWDTVGQDLVGEAGEIGIRLTTTTKAPKEGATGVPMFDAAAGAAAHALAPRFAEQMTPTDATPTQPPVAKWGELRNDVINQTAQEPVVTPDQMDQQAQDLAENMQGLDSIWKTRGQKRLKQASSKKKCRPKNSSQKKGSLSQFSQTVYAVPKVENFVPQFAKGDANNLGDDLANALQTVEDCDEEAGDVAVPEGVTDWSSASSASNVNAPASAKASANPAPVDSASSGPAPVVTSAVSSAPPAKSGPAEASSVPAARSPASPPRAAPMPSAPSSSSTQTDATAGSSDVVAKLKGLDLPWSQDGLDGLPSSFDSAVSGVSSASSDTSSATGAGDHSSAATPANDEGEVLKEALARREAAANAPLEHAATNGTVPSSQAATTLTTTMQQAAPASAGSSENPSAKAQSAFTGRVPSSDVPTASKTDAHSEPRVTNVAPVKQLYSVHEKHSAKNPLGNLEAAVDGFGENRAENVVDKLRDLDQPWSPNKIAEKSDAFPLQASDVTSADMASSSTARSPPMNSFSPAPAVVVRNEPRSIDSVRVDSGSSVNVRDVPEPLIHSPSSDVTTRTATIGRASSSSSLPGTFERSVSKPVAEVGSKGQTEETNPTTVPLNIPTQSRSKPVIRAEDVEKAANVADQLRDLEKPWSQEKIEENLPAEFAPNAQKASITIDTPPQNEVEEDESLNNAFKAFGSDVVPAPVVSATTPAVAPQIPPAAPAAPQASSHVDYDEATARVSPPAPALSHVEANKVANGVTDALKGLDRSDSASPSQVSDESGPIKDTVASMPSEASVAATPNEASVASPSPTPSQEAFDTARVQDVVGILNHASATRIATGPGGAKVRSSNARNAKPEPQLSSTERFERDIRWTDPLAGLHPATSMRATPQTPTVPSSEGVSSEPIQEPVTAVSSPSPSLSNEAAKVAAKLAGSNADNDDPLSKLGDAFQAFGSPSPAPQSEQVTSAAAASQAVSTPTSPAATEQAEPAPTFAKASADEISIPTSPAATEQVEPAPTFTKAPTDQVASATAANTEHPRMQEVDALPSLTNAEKAWLKSDKRKGGAVTPTTTEQSPIASVVPRTSAADATAEQAQSAKLVIQRLQNLGSENDHAPGKAPAISATNELPGQVVGDSGDEFGKLNSDLNSAFDTFGDHAGASSAKSPVPQVTDAQKALDRAEIDEHDADAEAKRYQENTDAARAVERMEAARKAGEQAAARVKESFKAPSSSPDAGVRSKVFDVPPLSNDLGVPTVANAPVGHAQLADSLPSLTKAEQAWLKPDSQKTPPVSAAAAATSSEDSIISQALQRRDTASHAVEILSGKDGAVTSPSVTAPTSAENSGSADATSQTDVDSEASAIANSDLPDWAVNRLWEQTQHAVTQAKTLDVNQDPEHILEARLDAIKHEQTPSQKAVADQEKALKEAVAKHEKVVTSTDDSYFNEALKNHHVVQSPSDDDLSLSTPASAFKDALSVTVAAPKIDTSDTAIDKLWEETQQAAAGAHSLHTNESPTDGIQSALPADPSGAWKLWDHTLNAAPDTLAATGDSTLLKAEPARTVAATADSALLKASLERREKAEHFRESMRSALRSSGFAKQPSESDEQPMVTENSLKEPEVVTQLQPSPQLTVSTSYDPGKSFKPSMPTAPQPLPWQPTAPEEHSALEDALQRRQAAETVALPPASKATQPQSEDKVLNSAVPGLDTGALSGLGDAFDAFSTPSSPPGKQNVMSAPSSSASQSVVPASPSFDMGANFKSTVSATQPLPWQPTASEEHSALNDALQRRLEADAAYAPLGPKAKERQGEGRALDSAVPGLDNSALSGLGDAFDAFSSPSSTPVKQNPTSGSPSAESQSALTASTSYQYETGANFKSSVHTTQPLAWQPITSEDHSAIEAALHPADLPHGSKVKEQQSEEKVLNSVVPGLDNGELSGLGDAFSAFGSSSSTPMKQSTIFARPSPASQSAVTASSSYEAGASFKPSVSASGTSLQPLPWQPTASGEYNSLDDALRRPPPVETAKEPQSEDKMLNSVVPGMDNSELSGLGDAFSAFGAPSKAAVKPNAVSVPAHAESQSASTFKTAAFGASDPFDDFSGPSIAAKQNFAAAPAQSQSAVPAIASHPSVVNPTPSSWQPSVQEEHSALDDALQRRQVAETMSLGPIPLSSGGHDGVAAIGATVTEHVAAENTPTTSMSSGISSMDDDFDDDPFKAAHEAAQRMTKTEEPQPKPRLRKPQAHLPAWATSDEMNVGEPVAAQASSASTVATSALRGATQRSTPKAPAPGTGGDMVEYYRNQLEGSSDW